MENGWDSKIPTRSNVPPVDGVSGSYGAREAGRSDSGHSVLLNVGLRVATGIWTLLAFSIIASYKETLVTIDDTFVGTFLTSSTIKFSSFFFFSYLLTVDVICFVYVLVTAILFFILSRRDTLPSALLLGAFILDQIFAYLLMSSATSAATGTRLFDQTGSLPNNFTAKGYSAVAFTYLAFFTMGAAALTTGRTWMRSHL